MSQGGHKFWDVVVGGAGIAASAASIRLSALGFHPLILCTSNRPLSGIEAVPDVAVPLFAELGMGRVLYEAQAMAVEGFENHWRGKERVVRPGCWIHVDRARLAEAAMREATRRGATLETCRSLPTLLYGHDGVSMVLEGTQLRFDAAIDATGRSAVWSRPVRRYGRQVADLYTLSAQDSPRGRLVRLPEGWAYRIGLNQATTVAIVAAVGRGRGRSPLDVHDRHVLGLNSSGWEYAGRRPAFPQWSATPAQGRRLAVGDAALAFDPVAGQGIRFALSSAFAAAAVINTWRNSSCECVSAERFYTNFVIQSRQRHLQFVEELWRTEFSRKPRPASLPEVVVFSGWTITVEIQIGSRIVTDEAVQLADGGHVRWVGGVDLLRVRDLAREPVRSIELKKRLASENLGPEQATALLAWCAREGVICGKQ
jgi:flavin-dependent dehydrogenase